MKEALYLRARSAIAAAHEEVVRSTYFIDLAIRGGGGVAFGRISTPVLENEVIAGSSSVLTHDEDAVLGFAASERRHGHPHVYRLSVVWLCAVLESAVLDSVAALLRDDPALLARDNVRELKGVLVEFIRYDDDQRAEHLALLLERNVRESLYGIERFDSLLASIGIKMNTHKVVKNTLVELFGVRNAIVHRRGRADDRLLKQCPWATWKIGAVIPFREDLFTLYADAAMWYLATLDCTLLRAYGDSPSESAIGFCDRILLGVQAKLRDRPDAKGR